MTLDTDDTDTLRHVVSLNLSPETPVYRSMRERYTGTLVINRDTRSQDRYWPFNTITMEYPNNTPNSLDYIYFRICKFYIYIYVYRILSYDP